MRNTEKIAALFLAATIVVSMTGCGGGGAKATEAAGTEAPKTEAQGDKMIDAVTEAVEAAGVEGDGKLLFFTTQNISDYGINDLGYFASQDIAEEYGLDLMLVEGSNDAFVRTTNLLDALETGDYGYCITASWYILDDSLAQANELDTKLIIYDTNPILDLSSYPGCYGISFRQGEGSSPTTVCQCLMSKMGQIGAVASQDVSILNDLLTGWLAGVKYFDDNMGGNTKYSVVCPSDSTVQGDHEVAPILYGVNCDIVYSITGTYCLGVAKACAEAGGTGNGRCPVGVDYDQYSAFFQSSDIDVEGYEDLVTPMERRIRESTVSAFDQMAGENCEMSDHRFPLADDGAGLVYNENCRRLTSEDVQKQLTEVENKIKSGEIKAPSYSDFGDYDQFEEFKDNPDARTNWLP